MSEMKNYVWLLVHVYITMDLDSFSVESFEISDMPTTAYSAKETLYI